MLAGRFNEFSNSIINGTKNAKNNAKEFVPIQERSPE
jgi:hypothetical protein